MRAGCRSWCRTTRSRRILPGQLASVHAGAARHGELDGAAEPPGIEQQGADVAQPCPVCRSGDTLSVAFFPFVDHAGNRRTTDPDVATDLSFYLDGTFVDSQLVPSAQFVLSPGRAPRS